MPQLHNKADVIGTYNGVDTVNYSELSVELSALDIVKTANLKIWVKDELEYTIVVTNIDESDPALPVSDVVVTDKILPEIARLVDDSVEIDGVLAASSEYDYEPVTGVLTVRLGTIASGASRTITFRVEFAQ